MTDNTFPWPIPAADERDKGQLTSGEAVMRVMDTKGLSLAERMVGIDVAECGGGWGEAGIERAAERLEVEPSEYVEHLWALLRKGVLTRIARRWY